MIDSLAVIAASIITAPALLFCFECMLGLRKLNRPKLTARPPLTVLMPAHNEAANIATVVAGLRERLQKRDRILVIADNCHDDTAQLARSAGADVAERHDPERRGKGYALAFGRKVLEQKPPQTVVVMDADCWTTSRSLDAIASESVHSAAVVQALYLFDPSAQASALVQFSNFALLIKNQVRQRALARMGAPALLQGTGMVFPWPAFISANLDTCAIAEDLEVGIDLLLKGYEVRWTEQGTIWSKPASQAATVVQRTRWEHGFLGTSLRFAPRLLRAAIAQKKVGLAVLALDLFIPPLALFATTLMACTAAALLFTATGGSILPAAILIFGLALISAATALTWLVVGRDTMSFSSLIRAPLYIAWKLPIYGRLLRNRERTWKRTSREP